MGLIATDRVAWSVSLSWLLALQKRAKQIKILFGMWTRVGSRYLKGRGTLYRDKSGFSCMLPSTIPSVCDIGISLGFPCMCRPASTGWPQKQSSATLNFLNERFTCDAASCQLTICLLWDSHKKLHQLMLNSIWKKSVIMNTVTDHHTKLLQTSQSAFHNEHIY